MYMEYHNMTKPMIRVHNTETNEIIDREMTDAEFAQYEIDQADYQARKQAQAQAAAARQAIYDRLGLTTDDLRALGL